MVGKLLVALGALVVAMSELGCSSKSDTAAKEATVGDCVATLSPVTLGTGPAYDGLNALMLMGLALSPGATSDTVAVWWGNTPTVVVHEPERTSKQQADAELVRLRAWVDANPDLGVVMTDDPDQSDCLPADSSPGS